MLELIFGIIIIIGILYTLQMMLTTDVQINKTHGLTYPIDLYPVSILKPLKGIDDNLKDNLSSFFKLDYPKYEILFGVSSSDDPAVAIVKELMQQYTHINSKLIIGSRSEFLNPKINNLFNIVNHAQYDYLLISDSNVKVESHYLKENMKLMSQPNSGLVTSTIKGTGAQNLGSLMENLHINTFVAGSVFFIGKVFKLPIVIGKSMLLKKKILEKINGFEAFANYLAEDHLMGKAVRNAGYNIYHSTFVINNVNNKWSVKRFFNRHLRWAMMRKKLNIFHYMSEILANPIIMALIYLLINFKIESFIIFHLIVLSKIIFDFQTATTVGSDLKWYHFLLIPIKDVIIGCIWFIPFVYSKIEWRGNTFVISRGTKLKPI